MQDVLGGREVLLAALEQDAVGREVLPPGGPRAAAHGDRVVAAGRQEHSEEREITH